MEIREPVKEACDRSMNAYLALAASGSEIPILEVISDIKTDLLFFAVDEEVRDSVVKTAFMYAAKSEPVRRITLVSGAFYKTAIQDPNTQKIIKISDQQECVIVATMDSSLESYIIAKKLERINNEIKFTEIMSEDSISADINILHNFWNVYSRLRMLSQN